MPNLQAKPALLRVLFVDDAELDVELATRSLQQSGLTVEWARVDNSADMAKALARRTWDVVICDHNMPDFDSVSALALLQERGADLPFIIVSGIIPDHIAIEAMRRGARDFVSKDNLARLAPVVEREIQEASNRAALRRAQASLEHLMHFDPLTGIANVDFLLEHLEQRTTGTTSPFLLLLVDINRFRKIARGMGMALANRVLRAVARRLHAQTGTQDFVARIAADRFALIIDDVDSDAKAEAWFQRLREAFAQGFSIQGQDLFLTCCIGGALYPDHCQSSGMLMQHAEAAMDSAKQAGPGQARLFNDRMAQPENGRLLLETALYHALVNQEFILHYQPQVELATGRIIGVEALLRWQNPERGLVAPGDFIPLLEETGLIVPVGEWLLGEACRQSVRWREAGHTHLRMAVNLSALQFQQPRLAESVADIIHRSGADPQAIELEITENIAMNQEEEVLETLRQLRDIGVSLAIDDFGTGYSSLSYLQQFPVNRLKIDQSFVRGPAADANLTIARAIIAMGTSLGLEVIAEGVETAEQRASLQECGCREGQGYHFARPAAPEALATILERGH